MVIILQSLYTSETSIQEMFDEYYEWMHFDNDIRVADWNGCL